MATRIDLADPEYYSQPKPTQEQVHEVQPPPQDSHIVVDIATILLASYALQKTVNLIEKILLPFGITKAAILPVVSLSAHGTRALPNSRTGANGLQKTGKKTRARARDDLYFRAAYIVSAAHRVQKGLNEKKPLRVILSREAGFYRQHEAARRGRLDAAAKVQAAAEIFGPLLGWYLNPLLNNEIECITANGHNFDAEEGTIIGLPGSVHPKCGCTAGPPHEGATMVNEALTGIVKHVPRKKILKLKIA